jgi:hypothetical protein
MKGFPSPLASVRLLFRSKYKFLNPALKCGVAPVLRSGLSVMWMVPWETSGRFLTPGEIYGPFSRDAQVRDRIVGPGFHDVSLGGADGTNPCLVGSTSTRQ